MQLEQNCNIETISACSIKTQTQVAIEEEEKSPEQPTIIAEKKKYKRKA